tara:strand:- start:49 stop:1005 length:957 start_codon:yes stop_codon:yes gene_type:complete
MTNKKALIGYTGFVGSNLKKQFEFDDLFNSTNINEIKGRNYDLVICAGIQGSMWLANRDPLADLKSIKNLLDILKTIKTKQFVLISTISVYKNPINVFEDDFTPENYLGYGKNRFFAENFIKNVFENYLIVRLPNLFGLGLKKNFIYDLLNRAPNFIEKDIYNGFKNLLSISENNLLSKAYNYDKKYKRYILNYILHNQETEELVKILDKHNISSLNFTHSESEFQFYYLNNLWKDITVGLDNNIMNLNLATEPIKAKEIAKEFFKIDFHNIKDEPPIKYNMKTKSAHLFGKSDVYLYSKKDIFKYLTNFFYDFGIVY